MKKTLLIAVGLIIAGAAGYFYFARSSEKKEVIAETKQPDLIPEVNQYPNMTFIMTDGSLRSARDLPAKSILILYFPDCDHCQREATEFSKNLKSFENYSLWFVSTASYKDIERFANDYKLRGYANIHFVQTETHDVIDNFGGIPTPSIYIYSEAKKLVKAFNGETKMEEIIKFL